MKLELPKIKDKMIMCRFDPLVFKEIEALAKKNKTSQSKIIRALVELSLPHPTKESHNKQDNE